MKMTIHALWPLLALALGCDALSNKKDVLQERNQFAEPLNTGCVQGVIVNGQTGDRIQINGLGQGEGLFVLAQTTRLDAASPAATADFAGEYTLCGVPLDDSFPIFARINGFNEFYSHVTIDSTVAQKSPKASVDIRKPAPTLTANIRLYPLGVETNDLKFQVVHNATPVAGATVRLTPEGRSYFDDANFLAPLNYRTQPAVMTTDASGNAIFPKDSLMLGAVYLYDVLPSAADSVDGPQSGSLTVGLPASGGVTTTANQPNLYTVIANLANSVQGDLAQVSSSLDSADYNPQGQITLVFNRAIKIAGGTADKQTAFLNNTVKAKLRDNVAGNGASEQVTVQITGNTLVITPQFAVMPDAVADAGLMITYSGILLQVADGPDNTLTKDLGNMSVKLFGGSDQPIPAKYAQTLEMTSGNAQSGTINQALAAPVKVRVYDQFGDPFGGQTINLTLQTNSAAASLANYELVTDSMGYASTTWTLGSTVGGQTLQVTAVALGNPLKNSPMTFSATAQDQLVASTLTVPSGNGQSGVVGTTLPLPVKILVVDQHGAPVAGQSVTFETAGGVDYSAVSDATGIAAFTWTLGNAAGSQSLTVRAVNSRGANLQSPPVSATATPAPTPAPTPTVSPTPTPAPVTP